MIRSVLITSIVLALLATAAIHFLMPNHISEANVKQKFVIDAKFDRVKQVLVLGDARSELVKRQHGEIVSEVWEGFSINVKKLLKERRFKSLEVGVKGKFVVKTSMPDLGSDLLEFKQDIDVKEDVIYSVTELVEPTGRIKSYDIYLSLKRDADKTRGVIEADLVYRRRIPESYVSHLDKRVKASLQESVNKTESGLIDIINEKKDGLFIPL